MTTDDIVAGIDRSLELVAAERERLLAARAHLLGSTLPTAPARPTPSTRRRRSVAPRGQTIEQVFQALDPVEPRTAGVIERTTGIRRLVVSSTLTRLAKQGRAAKAERGYLRIDP